MDEDQNTQTLPEMVTPDEPQTEQVNDPVEEPEQTEPEKPQFDKVRQQVQQELGNFTRNQIDPLRQQLTDLADAIRSQGGKATEAQKGQIAETVDDIQTLLKQEGLDEFDNVDVKTLTKVLQARDGGGGKIAKMIEELREEFRQQKEQQAIEERAKTFWSNFKAENPNIDGPKLWHEAQQAAIDKGLKGESAQGYAQARFDVLVEKAKADLSKKSTPAKSIEGAQVQTKGASTAVQTPTDGRDRNGLPRMI